MSGRGKFLDLKLAKTEVSESSSKEASNRDSGFASRPYSDGTKSVGRGQFLEDLTQQCSSLSIGGGRGRAQLMASFNTSENIGDLIGGRGRAKLLESLTPLESQQPTSSSQLQGDQVTESDESKEPQVQTYYRPDKRKGTKGNPVNLYPNYLRVYSDPNKGVFVYEVRFIPNIDSTNIRIRYLNEHRDKFGGTKTFDGVTLYLPILLPDKLTIYHSKSAADGSDITIRVLFKKQEVLKNCLQLYNVLFSRVMKTLKYVQFDRKQFDPTSPKMIPQAKLEVWPGYVTAVDEFDGGLMLCCDVSHRLLCQNTVLDTLLEVYHWNPGQFQENAKKHLLGAVIITRYNNRTYRIDDVCFEKSPRSTFPYKGQDISFLDYYARNHHVQIKDEKQPLLMSIKKQRTNDINATEEVVHCLIPELCYLTGLSDNIRSDARLMREIATYTRVSPQQRIMALEKFYNNINDCAEAREILNSWGLSLSREKEIINGRQFENENIIFYDKVFSAGVEADFSRYATRNTLLDVVPLQKWLLIYCKKDARVSKSLIENLDQCSRVMGMQVERPKTILLENDRVESYVTALRNNIKADTGIVVCISPTNRDDLYSAIKKICCAEIPVPSQVILSKTLFNETKNRSIVQKIALQINCKLGGSLWSIRIPLKNTMICGIDSYHDASQKGNSVGAFVASLNNTYSKWYSKAIVQTKKEEIISGLCQALIKSLEAYEKINRTFPENVIIYRDGVGDGQLQVCTNFEIPQLEMACKKARISLKITYIIVQKRINTRFFALTGNGYVNPSPGSVIDATITRPNMYDFFLVSQSVRQGTVTPAHYIVLRDDSEYGPDIIQRLSYKLCFMYYNWPGTIRVPACCQYAHKLASLVGQSIRKVPAEELAHKLFYL